MNAPSASIAPRVRSIGMEIAKLESSLSKKSETLDRYLDFHSAINHWILNTEHDQASLDIIRLMNQYLKVSEHSTSDVSG